MCEKRFTIKPQDDYWAVVDNYNDDKVCIINGIHTKIEAIWLCDFMNEQQAEIDDLNQENEKLRNQLLICQQSKKDDGRFQVWEVPPITMGERISFTTNDGGDGV